MDRTRIKKLLLGDFTPGRLVRSVCFVYVCLLVFALGCADRLIFQPQPSSYRDLPGLVMLDVDGGEEIAGLYWPDPDAEFTVLFSHGNAEDLGHVASFLQRYREHGYAVAAYDYRGYGMSTGRPGTRNAYADAERMYRYLVDERSVLPERIIVHGRSVGGGPAVYLGEKYPVAGLIVESSFVSAFRVMTRWPILPFDRFTNLKRIDKVECPVLVTHARADRVIPFWHGQALYERALEPKMVCWLDEAGHNVMSPAARSRWWAAVGEFTVLLSTENKGH